MYLRTQNICKPDAIPKQNQTKPTQTRRDQRVVSGGRLLALYLHRDCRKCKIKQRKKYNRIKQNGTEQNRIEHNKF